MLHCIQQAIGEVMLYKHITTNCDRETFRGLCFLWFLLFHDDSIHLLLIHVEWILNIAQLVHNNSLNRIFASNILPYIAETCHTNVFHFCAWRRRFVVGVATIWPTCQIRAGSPTALVSMARVSYSAAVKVTHGQRVLGLLQRNEGVMQLTASQLPTTKARAPRWWLLVVKERRRGQIRATTWQGQAVIEPFQSPREALQNQQVIYIYIIYNFAPDGRQIWRLEQPNPEFVEIR